MNELFFKLKIINALAGIIFKRKNFCNLMLNDSVKIFEKNLAEYTGSKYVLGVASCTDALILSLKALGIGLGDEVIVPSVSFYSSAGAVSWINAKPVFVDVSPKDHNIDVSKIEKAINSRTKAIIAVHLNGRMADMDEIMQIAKRHSLSVIEDAAQAIGSKYKNHHIGYYGDIACLSFNPSKILTGFGDGGAIVMKDKPTADKISLLRMYGATVENLSMKHSIVGVASRLSQFHAAVMNVFIDSLDNIVEKRRANYFLYSELLHGVGDLVSPEISPDYFINGYRYVILTKKRDELHKFLRDSRVDSRIEYSVPIPYLEAFSHLDYKKGDFPIADKVAAESLVLPTGNELSREKISLVADLIKSFFN